MWARRLLLQKANPSGNGTIADLKLRFNDGDNLVVLGGDPAYNAPTDIEWPSWRAEPAG